MSASAPSLLLLIPAYNEENRIGPVLNQYAEYFGRHYPGKFGLVVVLNGCRDDTMGVVQEAEKHHPCITHSEFPAAIGKGGALIEGLKLAPLADLIGYVDADGATPPNAFHDLVKALENPVISCAIASRWLPGAIVHHFQPENRRFASRLFHLFVEMFFQMRILDTQCGAKVMRRHAVETIHDRLSLADLAFDVRLACHGLDQHDNDFVIGLIGKSLHPLSHCVQTMRKTRQTAEYIDQMGPFFVGRRVFATK